ncbi:MAG: hypothetical protein KF696_13705 [Planctomycetes bacterium]|nr:hypothetical protein [Planctomycetota bacterium]MCW8137071.1 hypothetical protein [Planctomycetota bacterium]
MGTLRYALLNALLTPLDEQARLRTPENTARAWLQSQLGDAGFASDFRIVNAETTGLNATVEAEMNEGQEWRDMRLALEFAQGQWTVTAFEWLD